LKDIAFRSSVRRYKHLLVSLLSGWNGSLLYGLNGFDEMTYSKMFVDSLNSFIGFVVFGRSIELFKSPKKILRLPDWVRVF
jgi:hypothetical protein